MGVYNQALDTTDTVLAERRLASVRDLSEQFLLARSLRDFYEVMVDTLSMNTKDIPFGMFFSVNTPAHPPKDTANATSVPVTVKLESAIGLPEDHPFAMDTLRFEYSRTPSFELWTQCRSLFIADHVGYLCALIRRFWSTYTFRRRICLANPQSTLHAAMCPRGRLPITDRRVPLTSMGTATPICHGDTDM